MRLELTREQAEELQELLSMGLRELRAELAGTENPAARRDLAARRDTLSQLHGAVAQLLQQPAVALRDVLGSPSTDLLRESSRPGGG